MKDRRQLAPLGGERAQEHLGRDIERQRRLETRPHQTRDRYTGRDEDALPAHRKEQVSRPVDRKPELGRERVARRIVAEAVEVERIGGGRAVKRGNVLRGTVVPQPPSFA